MLEMPRTKEYSPRLRHRMQTQRVFHTWYAHLYTRFAHIRFARRGIIPTAPAIFNSNSCKKIRQKLSE